MQQQELSERYLRYIVEKGAHERYGEVIPQDVLDKIDAEYDVIIPNKFTDYILMIWDIHEFCRTPDRVRKFCARKGLTPPPDGVIPIGPGRGSVGGSSVCYCIGITQCDPLLFGLFFERFLNPERIAYPDIDFDISQKYRHIGIAYIADKYGADHVSQIITFGTLSKNNVVHDVLQALGIPNAIINDVKKTIPDDPAVELADIKDDEKFIKALQSIPFNSQQFEVNQLNVQRVIANNKFGVENTDKVMKVSLGQSKSEILNIKPSFDWEKALKVMLRLEKLNKNASKHAAGVVVAPVKLADNIPLMTETSKKSNDMVCQYEKQEVESLGYLKMDVLGLRTVDVNYDAEQMVRQRYDKDFSLNKIPYNDKEAIKLINDGDTLGIFQIEGTGFTQMMRDLDIGGYEVKRFTDRDESHMTSAERKYGDEIHNFMWISAGLALYRPGPLDAVIEGKTMVQHLIDRKCGKEPVVYIFSEEKNYLEETYGVLIYQEQVMSRVRQMTGCSYGRADILRKAMGKKDPVLMKEQMDWFKENAMNHKFSNDESFNNIEHKQNIVNRAAEEIEKFARYGFNKAHAVEYAHICYQNAYLKAHYPDCFFCALLNSLNDKPEKQTIMIRDMMNHGIELLPPDINESDADFAIVDDNKLRFGLSAIKQFKNASIILNDREENGKYHCVEEFRLRIPASSLNKTVITNLAKCGAFDTILHNNAGAQFENRASLVATMDELCKQLNKLRRKKPKSDIIPTAEEAIQKWENGSGSFVVTQAEDDQIQYAVWEKEIIKYYISAHPIDAYRDEMRRWNSIQNGDEETFPDEVYIAGFIEGCHETVIKKEGRNKGKKMGFVTIGTEFRLYEGTMFPNIYESCLPYIKSGNPVIMKCKKNWYKDKCTLQVEYIRNMSNSGIRDCPECHIRLNNPDDVVGMLQLKSLFDQHYGNTAVFIHCANGYDDITIRCAQTIALTDHIIDYVESIGTLAYKESGVMQ